MALWHLPSIDRLIFGRLSREVSFEAGVGLPDGSGPAEAPWIPDVLQDSIFPRAPIAARAGLHGAFASRSGRQKRPESWSCFTPDFASPTTDACGCSACLAVRSAISVRDAGSARGSTVKELPKPPIAPKSEFLANMKHETVLQ